MHRQFYTPLYDGIAVSLSTREAATPAHLRAASSAAKDEVRHVVVAVFTHAPNTHPRPVVHNAIMILAKSLHDVVKVIPPFAVDDLLSTFDKPPFVELRAAAVPPRHTADIAELSPAETTVNWSVIEFHAMNTTNEYSRHVIATSVKLHHALAGWAFLPPFLFCQLKRLFRRIIFHAIAFVLRLFAQNARFHGTSRARCRVLSLAACADVGRTGLDVAVDRLRICELFLLALVLIGELWVEERLDVVKFHHRLAAAWRIGVFTCHSGMEEAVQVVIAVVVATRQSESMVGVKSVLADDAVKHLNGRLLEFMVDGRGWMLVGSVSVPPGRHVDLQLVLVSLKSDLTILIVWLA
jgi:hypothetical protein